MKQEERCCGNCCWFKFEDIDGWGICYKQNMSDSMHCSDLCTTDKHVSDQDARHHLAVLIQHNRWRRDQHVPNYCMPVNPVELGKAIDFAVNYCKTLMEI